MKKLIGSITRTPYPSFKQRICLHVVPLYPDHSVVPVIHIPVSQAYPACSVTAVICCPVA